ncbi:MAG: tRNA (N6-isopentenyl adenosine(37)-C2)-methylthiotransferase MiaB [Bacteroidales bacterium]|nr:tRNA (N6-isopentenyl adenosine(37)-C2)-methylthiotransferase MiaB [Bacteroidales bacterium]
MLYHLVTLGCQMNVADSERVHSVIREMGYLYTENEEEANLLGVLACSVRQNAIDKVYSRIHKWNKWKNTRNLITFVSGCVLPADKEKFLQLFDLQFPTSEAENLPQMIREYGIITPASSGVNLGIPANNHIFSLWNLQPIYRSDFEAFVPIQNGCDKFCTFCAVPYTRGKEVSRPSEDILHEVETLVRTGYKSITLLGQNVNSYGNDKDNEIGFAELLNKIGEMGDQSGREFLVYFTSPHPRDMTPEVIDTIASYKCLAKQIHLPLQSGDDKVLIRMNRRHTMERYREIVKYIRKKLPQATLFTDIIVGFTGETDEQFLNTAAAMEEFRFNMAYIAQYSPRPGAAAYRWDDDISRTEKKYRLNYLTEILSRHSGAYNAGLIGKKIRVLVTGKDRKGGYLSGLTEGKINVRFASAQESLIGKFVNVKIKSATDFSLEGRLEMSEVAAVEA